MTSEGVEVPTSVQRWRVGTFAFPAQVQIMANEPVILNVYDMVRVLLDRTALSLFTQFQSFSFFLLVAEGL